MSTSTPPEDVPISPQCHQERVRSVLRQQQISQLLQQSPRRRRVWQPNSPSRHRVLPSNENRVPEDDVFSGGQGSGLPFPGFRTLHNAERDSERPLMPTPLSRGEGSSAPQQPLGTISNRQAGQRRRRAREAAEKASQIPVDDDPALASASRRVLGQLYRRRGQSDQQPVNTSAMRRNRTSNDLFTPPATQSSSSGTPSLSNYAIAQRARRERERREREQLAQLQTTPVGTGSSGGQRLRQDQLLTPPITQRRPYASSSSSASRRSPVQRTPPTHSSPRAQDHRAIHRLHQLRTPSPIVRSSPLPRNHSPSIRSPSPGPGDDENGVPRDNGFDPDYRAFIGTTGLFCAARRPYTEPVERHDLGQMEYECHHCGALHWLAEKISKSSSMSPEFGICCKHGEVRLPLLQLPPPYLHRLLTANDHQAKEFQENIVQYNAALAFTSVGVEVDDSISGRGPPVFRIHGELKHWSGTLLPRDGKAPSYAQLYILDPRTALQYQMHRNDNLNRETMEGLQTLLRSVNPYSQIYQHAFEVLQSHPDAPDLTVNLRVMPGQDRRRYNLPTADEVAAIVPGDGTQEVDKRDIILRLRPGENGDGGLQRVNDGHAAYAPLHYVLLFPRGESGWNWDLRLFQPDSEEPKRLTQTHYASFRLHPRVNEFSTILHRGRLLQRYAVDLWASADQNRLNYLRQNQTKLRASLYQGLEDALERDADLNNIGQKVILPSSYIGGPRHMHQRYQDAMAIACFFKKVDLFMTMTADPTWPEITRMLLPGQTAADRPDLVTRVFKMKRDALLDDMWQIFGPIAGYVYTIEFQKRGLPHMHLLIFLRQGYKLLSPRDIDTAIWARWPNPETEPQLFNVVKKCMVHGPCGALNPQAPCMENGKCTKNFPKQLQSHTTMDQEGYPLYYRPDDGREYEVGSHKLDNRWIVPYNPYLSAKYGCHINVECATSFKTVKYTVKYINKGHDRGTLALEQLDEIKQFIEGRYFSASEATWHIFHFDVHNQEPNIVRLPIHLPGQHLVRFDPTEDPELIRRRIDGEKSVLTAFFKANADPTIGPMARQYTYQEFPQHFVWKDNKYWKLRERGFALGRMYYVPPNAGECFYLRTLLTVVKGPKCWEDVWSYQGHTYDSFRDACLARGLLEDDGEWRQALEEASEVQTGHSLRQMFATLLLFCSPQHPVLLWNEFRDYICDDLQYRLRVMGRANPMPEDAYDYGLYLLDCILQESGHFLEEFTDMPLHQQNWAAQTDNLFIAEQLDYDREAEKERAEQNLQLMVENPEQKSAFDQVMRSVESCDGRLFFLNGPGGTGKTFVYKTICHAVRACGWITLCVASTGIAALLLPGGRTAHSMFKIPIEGLTEESHCNINKDSPRAELLRHTRIIIWDESPMQNCLAFQALDRTCCDIRDDDRPFGGITMVFGGDFQQILPVVIKGSQEDIVSACLKWSYLWPLVTPLTLTRNMRLQQSGSVDEMDFASWLLDIGHGRGLCSNDNNVSLRHGMRVDSEESLIDIIYPDLSALPTAPPPEYFLECAILAPRNSDVDSVNRELLDRLPGEERVYMSADSVVREQGVDGDEDDPIPPEILCSLDASGLPPGELHLKPGCPLILLRNLAPAQGLCNGTRMVLVQSFERVLEVKIIGGDHHGKLALIPRITLIPSAKNAEFSFILKWRQFPVRLAFAMTINKSQGQSLKYVGLDLRVPVFTHGQLYVGFS